MRVNPSREKVMSAAVAIAVAAIVLVVGLQVAASFDVDAYNDHHDAAEEWCSEYNGTLVPGDGMGVHAQLHCHTEDDRWVHMGYIAEMNYTHDWDRIENQSAATHENTPPLLAMPLEDVLPLVGITIGSILAVGGVARLQARRVDLSDDDRGHLDGQGWWTMVMVMVLVTVATVIITSI